MSAPLVSIHIICYNQAEFVRQALVSAIEQTYPNLEIIIADDCSIDATREVIEQVLHNYPRGNVIKIFNQKNLGITQNSNVALSRCKGEFIAFMGGDDVLLPGKIAEQINWFLADECRVLCGHDVEWIDQHGQSLNVLTSDLVPISAGKGCAGFIQYGTPYSATSVMVRRARIPSYGFHPLLPTVSDWKLWLDVIGEYGVYGYVPGVFAQYRRHVGNVTARRSWRITRDVVLTAILSLLHFRFKFLSAWLFYFFVKPIKKMLRFQY